DGIFGGTQMSDVPQAIPGGWPISHNQSDAGLLGWITTIDHKRIGILYMLTSLLFFIIGGIEAMALRTQLALPNLKFLSPEAYDQIFTMHGTTMIFLVVMPVLTGFAV